MSNKYRIAVKYNDGKIVGYYPQKYYHFPWWTFPLGLPFLTGWHDIQVEYYLVGWCPKYYYTLADAEHAIELVKKGIRINPDLIPKTEVKYLEGY